MAEKSSHIDGFAAENLPPSDMLPDLIFPRPELNYPPRLNCVVELLDRAVAEVERAEDAVAVFLFDHAFGVAEIERAGDFLAHGEDVAVGVDLDAEEAGDHAPRRRGKRWR